MIDEFKVYEGNNNVPISNYYQDQDLYNGLLSYEIDTKNFFKTDLYTDDYIHLLILKANPYDSNKNEELRLIAKPNIGIAKTHSSYSPVGNVSFSFVKDNDIMEYVFTKKIEQINIERTSKDLPPLSVQKEKEFKKSFMLLDSQRVYKKNSKGYIKKK